MTLGEFIRHEREKRGLSLRDVENALSGKDGVKISSGHLSLIEQGKVAAPSPRTLHALADALGVDYIDLMSQAGYLDPTALKSRPKSPAPAFRGAERLTDEQRRQVQDLIEFLANRRSPPRRRHQTGRARQDDE